MKKIIDESYVRGFADGEGYVCKSRPMIVITNTDKQLLLRISRFLFSINIQHKFKKVTDHNSKHKNCYRIIIYRKYALFRYAQKIGFCQKHKMNTLMEMLEGSRIVDWTEVNRIIFRYKEKGYSIRQIAKLLNIHFTTVWRHLNKRNHI